MYIPNENEFIEGCKEFKKHEKRDLMYKVATFLLKHFWGKPKDMADGLGVLLLTWNQAFYRYGELDYDDLENFLKRNMSIIESFKERDISSLSDDDEKLIKSLFNQLLDVLKIESKKGPRKSPVGVGKALHLLCPDFFPIWDEKIARAYKCYYDTDPSDKYVQFCKINKKLSEIVSNYNITLNKTTLKLIDEYNYSKYTKGWI